MRLNGMRFYRVSVVAGLVLVAQLFCASASAQTLRLATTTSTDNSGLLEFLLPGFERQCGCRVDVIAVGTGKALRLGENGDVDVLLVHDPLREKAFVEAGHGRYRRYVMYNDFVLLGPAEDPAGVRKSRNAAAAFSAIAGARAVFVSRGDESGTHAKEKSMWRAASVAPGGDWYRETGQGMGATIQVADQMRGYTLADRGTFLAMRDKLGLQILLSGDPRLHNPYGVIPVLNKAISQQGATLAQSFAAWITGADAQSRIASFKKYGQVLFHPAGGKGLPPRADDDS